MEKARADERIRLAELMAALSLAHDLGLGRPLSEAPDRLATMDTLTFGPQNRARKEGSR